MRANPHYRPGLADSWLTLAIDLVVIIRTTLRESHEIAHNVWGTAVGRPLSSPRGFG
jgi:hypothetical protein